MHRSKYEHTRIVLGHFRYVCYSRYVWYTVALGALRTGSVFSTSGIIPSEFWYICGASVRFTLYKL